MIGITCIALAYAQPPISPEASELMLRTGMQNTGALLEELGLNKKAIYVPRTSPDTKSMAIIPLSDSPEIELARIKLTGRLIVRYGDSPEAMAIAVTTPGGISYDLLETKPGPSLSDIESALNHIYVGQLDIASSCSVSSAGQQIKVMVNNSKLHAEDISFSRSLGSPLASIAATVTCEAMGKPVRIIEETRQKSQSLILLEVFS